MTRCRVLGLVLFQCAMLSRPRTSRREQPVVKGPRKHGTQPVMYLSLVAFVSALVPAVGAQDKKPAPVPDTVSYYKDVRPIFVVHCQGCHQPAKPMGGFVMTSHADLLKKGDSDEPGVVAAK